MMLALLLLAATPSVRFRAEKPTYKLIQHNLRKAKAWSGQIPAWHFWRRDKGCDVQKVKALTDRAVHLAKGTQYEAQIESEANRLNEAALQHGRSRMARLKYHRRWEAFVAALRRFFGLFVPR